MFGKFFCYVYRKIVFFFSVDHFNSFELTYQYTGVTYLTTAFCIERGII